MIRPTLAAVASAALLAGCSSTDTTTTTEDEQPAAATPPTQTAQAPSRCRPAKRVLVEALEESLRTGGPLRDVQYVRSRENRTSVPGFAAGVYYVSADSDVGTLTWAVSESMLSTGGGLAVALGGARSVSELGADVDPGKIGVQYGEGYAESQDCVS